MKNFIFYNINKIISNYLFIEFFVLHVLLVEYQIVKFRRL